MSDPDATPSCPAGHGLSAPITPAERREFVPFMHRLIGAAFAAIKPLFLRGVTVRAKADTTPVTAADRGAEAAMRREIERAYPAHGIVGEEYGEKPGRG